MSSSWAKGSTRAWRKLRLAVLTRDQYLCQLRLPGTCQGRATHVHHTHGKRHGDNPTHLIAACAPCNLKTGDPTRRRDPPNRPVTRW